jgi:hypothetical protein
MEHKNCLSTRKSLPPHQEVADVCDLKGGVRGVHRRPDFLFKGPRRNQQQQQRERSAPPLFAMEAGDPRAKLVWADGKKETHSRSVGRRY